MAVNHTRRQWLEGMLAMFMLASTSCAKGAGLALAKKSSKSSTGASRPIVARAKREGVVQANSGAVDSTKLEAMLGAAIARAAGDDAPLTTFKRIFRPSDVVGIKVGTLAGPGLSPHPELVQLLVRWLVAAGVREQSIVIWDRLDPELERAGFKDQPHDSRPALHRYEPRLRLDTTRMGRGRLVLRRDTRQRTYGSRSMSPCSKTMTSRASPPE